MKHSVALILPYFGTLPNYFPLWLKSAGANPDFTFMLFTDCDMSGYNIPENVQVHHLTFDDIKRLIAPHLDFPFMLNTPYKLCDYKPMYGLIFRDYLSGYDFWGHVDPDVIWGNMSRFITDGLLDKYGRLYRRGHLIMYSNTPSVNSFALNELPGWNFSYKDVYRTEDITAFDENALTEQLFSKFALAGGGGNTAPDYADVRPHFKQFIVNGHTVPAFRWKNGKVYGLSIDGKTGNDTEYLYVQLQKRAMTFTPGLENENSFMIIPNEFVREHELTQEEITASMTPDPEYERNIRRKYSRMGRGLLGAAKAFFETNSVGRKIILHRYMCRILGRKSHI